MTRSEKNFKEFMIDLIARYQITNGYEDMKDDQTANDIAANYDAIKIAIDAGIEEGREATMVLGAAWGIEAEKAAITAGIIGVFKQIWPPKTVKP